MNYNNKFYWEKRMDKYFNLRGVGDIGYGEYHNEYLYKLKKLIFNSIIKKNNINLSSKNITDIGCGTGFFIDYFREQGAKKIVGVDITEIVVNRMKKLFPDSHFVVVDISKKTNLPKSDIVNILDVLQHIVDDKKFLLALNNACSLVKDGGYIFIADVFEKTNKISEDTKFRSLSTYKKILQKNHFIIADVFPLRYTMLKARFLKPIINHFKPLSFFLYTIDTIFFRLGLKMNFGESKILIARKVI